MINTYTCASVILYENNTKTLSSNIIFYTQHLNCSHMNLQSLSPSAQRWTQLEACRNRTCINYLPCNLPHLLLTTSAQVFLFFRNWRNKSFIHNNITYNILNQWTCIKCVSTTTTIGHKHFIFTPPPPPPTCMHTHKRKEWEWGTYKKHRTSHIEIITK